MDIFQTNKFQEFKELIFHKADSGNTVVLLNRKYYISKMKSIVANTSKFKKIQIDDSKVLNHLIQRKTKLLNFSKNLKKNKKFLVQATIDYTLQVQAQAYHTLFVKYKKVLLMTFYLFDLYYQL